MEKMIKDPFKRFQLINKYLRRTRMAFPDDLTGGFYELCKILKKDKWDDSFHPFGPQLKKAQFFLEDLVKSKKKELKYHKNEVRNLELLQQYYA